MVFADGKIYYDLCWEKNAWNVKILEQTWTLFFGFFFSFAESRFLHWFQNTNIQMWVSRSKQNKTKQNKKQKKQNKTKNKKTKQNKTTKQKKKKLVNQSLVLTAA